jgi:hypothetical protein
MLALVGLMLLPVWASAGRSQTLTATNASATLKLSQPASMTLAEQVAKGSMALSSRASSTPPPTRYRPSIAGPLVGGVAPGFSGAPLRGQHGITVLLVTDPSFATKAGAYLDHLAALGVNSVSAVIVFTQQTYTSTTMTLASFDPTPTEIQSFINAAHARGISVMVRPLMDDTNIIAATNGAQWRGTVDPTDPNAWFANYQTTVIQPYAALSGIDMFDVGSELTTLGFKYPTNWSNLISALRSTYPGERLTFSSTDWFGLPGQQQPYPSFAPALDLIGVDAFFPMNGVTNGYDISQLVRAWQPWLSKMAQLGAYYHKSILFTEVGLASQCCTLTQPFVYHAGAATNLQAQAAYYAAACQAIRPYHIGIYWWAYNAMDPVASPATDNSFTPYGKPAEQEMARCYLSGS